MEIVPFSEELYGALGLAPASPYHQPAWLWAMSEVLGGEARAVVWKGGGLPFVQVRKGPFRAGYSLPLDSPGGVVGLSPPSELSGAVRRYHGFRIADYGGSLELEWPRRTVWSFRLNPAVAEPSRSQRKAARQAEERGLRLRTAEPAELASLYPLYEMTMSGRGGLYLDEGGLARVVDGFGRAATLTVAEKEGGVVAFLLCLWSGTEGALYCHGVAEARKELRPMSALVLDAINRGRERGIRALELGSGDAPDDGSARFKLSFGAKARPFHIYHREDGFYGVISKLRGGVGRKKKLRSLLK